MYGAILGDIIGQPYEFGPKTLKQRIFHFLQKSLDLQMIL